MSTTTFKGARYLVKFEGEWVQAKAYEAIVSVLHEGSTYISKQPVPENIPITNTDYWLLWADPNAQMQQLRELVEEYADAVDVVSSDIVSVNERIDAIEDASFEVITGEGDLNDTITADWILLKLKRSDFEINVNNNDDNPEAAYGAYSNPLAWLANHPNVFIAHNASFSGGESTSATLNNHYAMRYNGINYNAGAGATVVRPNLAVDTVNQQVEWFSEETAINAIPSNYQYVFACGNKIIDNGLPITTVTFDSSSDATRAVFGWDNNYFYIFYSEGRNLLNKGLGLVDIANMLYYDYGVLNAVNLDGGGSVMLAMNTPEPMQINGYVDQTAQRGSHRVTALNLNYTYKED